MTQFLVAIPRRTADGPDRIRALERVNHVLSLTAEGYGPFAGADYDAEPSITAPSTQGETAVLTFSRHREQDGPVAIGDYWAVSAGSRVTGDLVTRVRRIAGRLSYVRPVWGQYAAVFAERYMGRITAWNTVPALEAIHWGVSEEFVFVANRPLLVALALQSGVAAALPLSSDYLVEYLLYGYSISGQTPFHGVKTIPADRALTVHRGQVDLTEIPPGLTSSLSAVHSVEDGAEALAAALTAAMDRTEKDLAGRPLQLRLSGGKDSRLLAGLLRSRSLSVRALTFGLADTPDVRLGRVLAERADLPFENRIPQIADADSLHGQVSLTIRGAGGIPASEPHTARFRGADPRRPHEAIMMGQWPLTKGGLAKRMRYSPEAVRETLVGQGGSLVAPEVRRGYDEAVKSWVDQVPATSELEKLYLFARQFRSGRYLHAHVAQYGSEARIAYPISDAEVAAVCDALSMHEKVSERALFGALSRIWPEVMALPLDRSVWRFESGGPDPEFSGPYYEDRHQELPPIVTDGAPVKERPSEHSVEIAVELASGILASDHAPLFATLLDEGMWNGVEATAQGTLTVPSSLSRMEFTKYLWRIYVADVWLSKSWLTA